MMKEELHPVILMVGHSTRPLAELIALLMANSVARLIDVRTVPQRRCAAIKWGRLIS